MEEIAWTNETRTTADVQIAQPVGTKKANPFGLHDMLGNALEWCADCYAPGPTGSIPLVDPLNAFLNRCGHRTGWAPNDPRDAAQGFRIAIVGDLKSVVRVNAVQPTPTSK